MRVITIREKIYDQRVEDIMNLLKLRCEEIAKGPTQFERAGIGRNLVMEEIRRLLHYEITRMLQELKEA